MDNSTTQTRGSTVDHREQQPADLRSVTCHSVTARSGDNAVAPQLIGCSGNINFSVNIQPHNTGLQGSSGSATPENSEKHFIDLHRTALIERVSNVTAILDRLLDRRVVTQRGYNEIQSESTSQNKMGKLLSGPIHSGGRRAKDVLFEILETQEPFLMEELKALRK
ncbi:apoptosis-associated speck-like protein containing a CARD [Conger conger]|uniref:apoptosis-associated speck-like protein containing a CARD n=1 Tax=Conger conger TaxID=82655 RepID=UPI002A5A4674|nr:apoptosis-associated speck-like protein containing a CARD [Conger conger]